MLPLSPPAYQERHDEFCQWLDAASENELWDARAEAVDDNRHGDAWAIREALAERFPEPYSE